ncbi:hypothetical protein J7L67_03055 [bacterium]|nr:hypothetical protein [bacterium]
MLKKHYFIHIVSLIFIFSFISYIDKVYSSQSNCIHIPANLAVIEGNSQIKKGTQTVIHIQDAHCFYPVQKQIINILEYLASSYAISDIFVEGADNYLNADSLKTFPDEQIRKNVSEYFLKKGKISGVEYFIINDSSGIKAKGAEDKKVYQENYNAFTQSQAVRDEILLIYNRLDNIFKILKQEFYSKKLLETDNMEKSYLEGTQTLRRYLNFLISKCSINSIGYSDLKNIVILEDITALEKQLNYFLIEQEKNRLISILQEKLSTDQKAELLDATLSYSINKTSPSSLFNLLITYCESNDIPISKFPEMKKYTSYLNKSKSLNMQKLDSEIYILTNRLQEKLLRSDEQRILIKSGNFLKTIKKIIQLKASSAEMKLYSDKKQWFLSSLKFILDKSSSFSYPSSVTGQAETLIDKMRRFDNFYVWVFKRDRILVQNTLKQMNLNKINVSVLITGGFHSEGIRNELSGNGVSVISIRPNLLESAAGYKSNYTNAILGKRNALENYLFLNWNALAVASILVDGPPLAQEWKGKVYKHEFEITEIALKLCAIRTKIESALGIEAGQYITAKIAINIASQLKQQADDFLQLWNSDYKNITGEDHPLLKKLNVSINTVGTDIFLELAINNDKIFFPLKSEFTVNPAALIDSFLTPQIYTSILAGNPYVKETITSFDQIKNMRARIKKLLANKNSGIDFITEQEKHVITTIMREIIQSNPKIFAGTGIKLSANSSIDKISEAITKAVSDIYVFRISEIASRSLNYDDLYAIIGYGACAPLHFMMKALKKEEPYLASFFEYLIDNYSLFSPDNELSDIRLITENLFDKFLLTHSNTAELNIDSNLLHKISDMVYAGLKIGDGIRPHAIVSAIAYGLNLSESMTLGEILEIHDIFEKESIYNVNEVIKLLLSSYYINANMAKSLIKNPFPFNDLMEILKSNELKALKINPSPQNFSFFINRFKNKLNEPTILELYTYCLPMYDPIRNTLTSLLAQGWDTNNKRSARFNIIAAQQKFIHLTKKSDRFDYDMIIISLLGVLPEELSLPDNKIAGIGIHSLDQLDSLSPRYDELILNRFIKQSSLSNNQITILSLDPGFISNLDEITTSSGLNLNRIEYEKIIYSYLQSIDTPVMLFADKEKIPLIENKLNSLNLSAMIIIVPYDYKENDISIDGKKKLDFLGYWINFIDILNKNFNGKIRLINADRNAASRFDDFSRDYIDIETLMPKYDKISNESVKTLAAKGNSETLNALIVSGQLTAELYPDLTNNENFNIDSIITIIRDTELPLTNELLELIYKKISRYDFQHIFSTVQNMRAAILFNFSIHKNPDIIDRLYGDIPIPKLINIFVLAQKLGFTFTEQILPDSRQDSFFIELAYKTALLSPSLAASMFTASLNKSPESAASLMEKLTQYTGSQPIIKELFIQIFKNYSVNHPEFIELMPFFQSDITPLRHKAFILKCAIKYIDKPKKLHHYIYAVLNIFNEQNDFFEWIEINKQKHKDRVDQWLQVVSLYPEIHELRSANLLQSAIMTDIHILNQYREFIVKLASEKEPYKSLQEDTNIFQLIFKAINSAFSMPIESKMYIFHILPFILDYLPDSITMEDIFDNYLEKSDRQGNIIKQGIPIYAILPAITFAEGNTQILDQFKALFSNDYISKSISEKTHLVSSFLRVFASINQAYLYETIAPELLPEKDGKKQFLKILSFNTHNSQRQDLLKKFQVKKQSTEYILNQFQSAQRKYNILLKLLKMTSSKTAKKDQKIINDTLDFLFILSENYQILQQAKGKPNEKFDRIINNFESYKNLRDLKKDLMKVFAEFIKIDFPDVFESEDDVLQKLPRIEKIAGFWIYKNDWQKENQHGIELLRQAVHDYLLDGSSIKHLKYGGTPESAKQMALLESLLYQRILSRIKPYLKENEAKQKALKLTAHYLNAWKTDMSETIDLSLLPPAKSNESFTAWTSDEVPDWMNFGMSGGATCLAPGNISVYTKNLPGYIFSGLVSGGLYFGKYKGDIRDRVNQGLLPVIIDGEPNLFLVNQYYYSSGGQTGDQIGYASILASIRNAARYGADGVIIPTGSPQNGYLSSLENFLTDNFSTVIEHRSSSGKIIQREKITVKKIDSQPVNLIVPKEPNQWRYFDAAQVVKGTFYEKLNDNFSFVNFRDCVPYELAGVNFEGLEVETESKVIMLQREELPIDETYKPRPPQVSLSEAIKTFMQEGRLISLSQIKPELKGNFEKLSFSKRTTGKFLNNLLYLSEQLSNIVKEKIIIDDPENKFFVLSATKRALPIVRKLCTMLEGRDFITGEINTGTIITDNAPSRTVFIVDEAILTGSTASKQIETILEKNDVLPEEIIFIALTADPKAVERILRKYPDIQMAVGIFEKRTEQEGTIISSVIADQITDEMLFDLSQNPKVTLGNVEYKIIGHILRSQTYNSFLAETQTGEKVFLKTTVSAAEGRQFKQIWELISGSGLDLGVPEVYQYDETTGILAASYIEGPAFNDFVNNNKKAPSELMINILDAIRDASEVAQFLSKKGELYVNITPNNIRLNLKNNKWYITNYSPFPYRMQPLEESGVLRQLEWIIEDVLKIFYSYDDKQLTQKDKTALRKLEGLLAKIKSNEIDQLYKLMNSAKELTQSLLSADNLFETYSFNPQTVESLKPILKQLNLSPADLEYVYTLLRLKLFPDSTVAGILKMYSNLTKNDPDIQLNISKILMDISSNIDKSIANSADADYIFLDGNKNLLSALYSDNILSESEIQNLSDRTNAFKKSLQERITSILEQIKSGRPVVLSGNIETIKWVYEEIFNIIGEEANQYIYIITQLSQFQKKSNYNPVLLARPVISAGQLFFSRSFKRANQDFKVTETSILNWNETSNLKNQNLSTANHIRLRIINNPRFNILIRKPDKTIAGLMSAAAFNYHAITLDDNIPRTTTGANTLLYYSIYTDSKLAKTKFFNKILLDIQHHISLMHQYSEIFEYHSSYKILNFSVKSSYIPMLTKKLDTHKLIGDIIKTGNYHNIYKFFFNADDNIKPLIQNAVDKIWASDSAELTQLLEKSGQSAFIEQTIVQVTDYLLNNYKDRFNGQKNSDIIFSILGISFSPVNFLSTSAPCVSVTAKDVDKRFENYSKKIGDYYPLAAALNKSVFKKLLRLTEGTDAFKLWLTHHDKELLPEWENNINRPLGDIKPDFIEKFGSALLSFLQFTGRPLPDESISGTLTSTNGIITRLINSKWNDPLRPDLNNMSMGYGFLLRMPYLSGSEEDYIQNWFDRDTSVKLNEFINTLSSQSREKILINIINMDFDNNYKSIIKLIKAILNSPLNSEARTKMLESNLSKIAGSLQEFDKNSDFLIFDTNSNISPAEIIQSLVNDPNSVLFLTGDYHNARNFYNSVNRYLTDDINHITDINNRIIGLTPFIKNQPDSVNNFKPFLQFNMVDDAVTTAKITALPNIPLTDSSGKSSITPELMGRIINEMLGQGGLLSIVTEKQQKDPLDLTGLNIIFESAAGNNMFLKITLFFGNDQYEVLSRTVLKSQAELTREKSQQTTENLNNITDNILSPLPTLARRRINVSNQNVMDFSIFETYPAGCSVLPVFNAQSDRYGAETVSQTKQIIRKQTEQLTRLWQLYGVMPNLNQSNFLIEQIHDSINLYLLADPSGMTPADNGAELFFNLFVHFGINHSDEILKGIFDAFEGNTNLFNSFIKQIKIADYTNLIANKTADSAKIFLPDNTPQPLVNHIQLRISNLIKNAPQKTQLNFTDIIAFLQNAEPLETSLTQLNNYANRLIKQLSETQAAITAFTGSNLSDAITGVMQTHLKQLENIFVSEKQNTLSDNIETIESYLKIIQDQHLLVPTQIINAQLLSYRLLFSEQFTAENGSIIHNKLFNPQIIKAIDKIYYLMQTHPETLIQIAPSIAEDAHISPTRLWTMILPGFNKNTQSFSIENVRLPLSLLPLLIRAEKALKTNPILLTADSSLPENSALFRQAVSLFKINILKTDTLSQTEYAIKMHNLSNKRSYEQQQKLLQLKQLLKNRVYPIAVDTHDSSVKTILSFFKENQIFNFQTVTDIKSFLENIVTRFDSSQTERISFSIAPSLLPENYQDKQDTIDRLIRAVIDLRLKLNQAAAAEAGENEAKEDFLKYARLLGIEKYTDELILNEKIKTPQITMTALILDKIKKSGKFPELNDFLSSISKSGKVNETKFLILVNVYTNLALRFFAGQIAQLAENGDVTINTDTETIRLSGKVLLDSTEDYKYIFTLLKEARISVKTFKRDVSSKTVIKYAKSIIPSDILFIRLSSDFLSPAPADSAKRELNNRSYELIESAL